LKYVGIRSVRLWGRFFCETARIKKGRQPVGPGADVFQSG
jgi:hypothetical protein